MYMTSPAFASDRLSCMLHKLFCNSFHLSLSTSHCAQKKVHLLTPQSQHTSLCTKKGAPPYTTVSAHLIVHKKRCTSLHHSLSTPHCAQKKVHLLTPQSQYSSYCTNLCTSCCTNHKRLHLITPHYTSALVHLMVHKLVHLFTRREKCNSFPFLAYRSLLILVGVVPSCYP